MLQREQTDAQWQRFVQAHGAKVDAAVGKLEREGKAREAFKLRLAWSGATLKAAALGWVHRFCQGTS